MERAKILASLMALVVTVIVAGRAQEQFSVDATRQPLPPTRGRGPFPGSATAGHSRDLPVRLDLLIPTGELRSDGTLLVNFRITNIGNEPIALPVSIDQGSFLPQPPITEFTMDVLTLWLTSDAIRDEYLEVKGREGQVRRLKTESPTTSAELYGRSDDAQTFHALPPNQSIIVHASSRVAVQEGSHSVTAHAELAREFIGSNNTSPPSRHQTGKLIGTADSESQRKMLSTAKPQNRIVPQAQQQKLSAISQNSVVWITREQQEAILQRFVAFRAGPLLTAIWIGLRMTGTHWTIAALRSKARRVDTLSISGFFRRTGSVSGSLDRIDHSLFTGTAFSRTQSTKQLRSQMIGTFTKPSSRSECILHR